MMKLIFKARKGHHGKYIVKAVKHAERQAVRLFCRRCVRGEEVEA